MPATVSAAPVWPLEPWNAVAYFGAGSLTLDRGGVWLAARDNRNSRPSSGNADWSLAGGIPAVGVQVTLTERRFMELDLVTPIGGFIAGGLDAWNTTPFEIVPAPGANQVLGVVGGWLIAFSPGVVAFGETVAPHIIYDDAAPTNASGAPGAIDATLSTPTIETGYGLQWTQNNLLVDPTAPIDLRATALLLSGDTDMTLGDGSFFFIIPYTITNVPVL